MSTRRYYLDLAADADRVPEPGTILRAPRVDHEIVDCWPTDSKVWPWRWTCILRPLGEHHGAPAPADAPVLHTRPYRRGEGPHDCLGDPDRSEVRP